MPSPAVEADERDGVPEEELHPEGMHPVYVCAHVRDLLGHRLPVAGVGVAPLVAGGLPAIVPYLRLASQFFREATLLLDAPWVEVLVEAVPRRVHRQPRRLWHPSRLVTGQTCPPAAHVGQCLVVREVPSVESERSLVDTQRPQRSPWNRRPSPSPPSSPCRIQHRSARSHARSLAGGTMRGGTPAGVLLRRILSADAPALHHSPASRSLGSPGSPLLLLPASPQCRRPLLV